MQPYLAHLSLHCLFYQRSLAHSSFVANGVGAALLVDPADGKLPALTPEGLTVQAQLAVDGIRHTEGVTNEGIATQMALYEEAIAGVPQHS